MAIDVELKTLKQNNTSWPLTFKASNRFPIVANRVFATLDKAQQYVDDTAADASAYQGIILAVVQDTTPKNNGVYYVSSVAMTEGEKGTLVKVGGTETETAADYAAAVELSKTLVVGQLIKVENEYTENEGTETETTYQKGFYIVDGAGVISALATSTGADDEVGALKTRVDAVEVDVKELEDAVAAIEIPVKDVMVGDESLVDENGIARIVFPTVDLTPYETIENVDKVRADVSANTQAIAGKVAQGDFDALAGRVTTAEGEIETLKTTKADAQDLIDGLATKVDVVEGSRLMTNAEGTKLEGIAEGAQVNVIEKIVFNGSEAVIDSQTKTVTLTTPADFITGLATEDKVLSVSDGKLSSTLSLNYYKAEDGSAYEIQLVGKDNTVVGRVDAKDFVKDGMLNNVELKKDPEGKAEGTYLIFTWNNEAGVTEPMYVPVTDLMDVYEAGNGIALDGKKFSVALKSGEAFLEVTEGGLATKGIQDAITTAKNEVVGDSEDTVDEVTLHGVKKYAAAQAAAAQAAAIESAVGTAAADAASKANAAQSGATEAAKVYTDAEISKINEAITQNGNTTTEALNALDGRLDVLEAINHDAYITADTKVLQDAKDYADETFVTKEGFNEFETAYEEKLNGIAAGAEVNVIESVKVNGVDATISNKAAEVTIDSTKIALGKDIVSDGTTVYASNKYLSEVLQGIQDSIAIAVSGGLTGVVAGNGIEVSEVAANKQTVSVKVSTVEGNMITADENGIYAAMYYEGDDAE
jgi:hypothetical protein